jgi:hypothetical protein
VASRPRAFLENLATTRPSTRSRGIPIPDLEQHLEQELQRRNWFREPDEARIIL